LDGSAGPRRLVAIAAGEADTAVVASAPSLDQFVADKLRPLVHRLILDLARDELALMANGHGRLGR
jgi:hypothetical protein